MPEEVKTNDPSERLCTEEEKKLMRLVEVTVQLYGQIIPSSVLLSSWNL